MVLQICKTFDSVRREKSNIYTTDFSPIYRTWRLFPSSLSSLPMPTPTPTSVTYCHDLNILNE